MMIIGEAYTPDVFAKAQALLQKARAACELDADIARIDFLGLGLRHGMLTQAAYNATLNQTSCTSADGDVTVGFNQSATCDVRAAVPAARELREYRIQIKTTGAVNTFVSDAPSAAFPNHSSLTISPPLFDSIHLTTSIFARLGWEGWAGARASPASG